METASSGEVNNPRRKLHWSLLALIGFSLLFFIASVVLRVGIGNTAYETTDHAGRTMGYNDRLSAEHYQIIVGNFRIGTLFSIEYAYEWFLLLMHLIGGSLLLNPVERRACRFFFFCQAILFPFGWLGFLFLPPLILDMARFRIDREGIIDFLFIWFTAHPVWLAASLVIGIALCRKPSERG